MSAPREAATERRPACEACLRRSWLLGELSALLDYHRGDPPRLRALLELPGEALIAALAGRRREELARAYGELDTGALLRSARGGAICPHTGAPPASFAAGERMLWLSSSRSRAMRLLDGPSVAIIGGRSASPYGVQMAASLGRGLAAAGVTLLAGLAGELAQSAHHGVLAAGGASLALAGDGLGRIRPAEAARLAALLARRGCVAAELPWAAGGRGWGALAAEQAAVELAEVTILVEAYEEEPATAAARALLARGGALGAVPGPVTSRRSAGAHELLREGATLIADTHDALELLHRRSPGRQSHAPSVSDEVQLEGLAGELLERIGAGEDSPERLARDARDPGAVIAALGELEAMGLITRLPGGRYGARDPARRPSRPG